MICLLRQRNKKVIRQQKRNYQTVFFISFRFFFIWIKKECNDQSRLTTCLYFTTDRSVHVGVLHLERKKKQKIMFINIALPKQAAERTF